MPAICSRVHCKHILWGKVQGDEGRTGVNLVLKYHFYEAFVVALPGKLIKGLQNMTQQVILYP